MPSHFAIFIAILANLASKIRVPTSGSFLDYMAPPAVGSFFMFPTTPQEIESLSLGLDPSKGPVVRYLFIY